MSILDYIYEFVHNFFVEPFFKYIEGFNNTTFNDTPITLTMPGSNVVLLTTDLHDLVTICVSIFLLIASMVFFWGVIKILYKVGRSFFGGRR